MRRQTQRLWRWSAAALLLAVVQPPVARAGVRADRVPAPTQRLALIVAVEASATGIEGTPGAVETAEEVARVLRDGYGYSRMVELYGEQATGAAILRSLAQLERQMVDDGALIVYAALPATLSAGSTYLVPWDGERDKTYSLLDPGDLIERLGMQQPAGRVLTAFDACLVASPSRLFAQLRRQKLTFLARRAANGVLIDRCQMSESADYERFGEVLVAVLREGVESGEAIPASSLAGILGRRLDFNRLVVQGQKMGSDPDFLLQPAATSLEPGWPSRLARDNPERVREMSALSARVAEEPEEIREALAAEASRLLIEIATDPSEDEAIRARAIFYLGRMGHAVAARQLAEIYRAASDAPKLLETVLLSLAEVGGDEAAVTLEEAIRSPHGEVRRLAIDGLARLGRSAALPAILEQLSREAEDPVKLSALKAVMSLRPAPQDAYSAVSNAILADGASAELQRTGVRALSTLADPRAAASLGRLLRSSGDEGVRQSAAFALGELAGAGARRIPALAAALTEDASSGVRESAALALGKSGSPRAAAPLIEALGDPEPGVRAAAAESLGTIGHRPAGEKLIEALKDPSSAVRRNAAVALGQLGTTGAAIDLLVVANKDPDFYVREAAQKAFERLDLVEIGDLVTPFGEAEPALRVEKLQRLAADGRPSAAAIALAFEALDDREPIVAEAAVDLLVGGEPAAPGRAGVEERLIELAGSDSASAYALIALGRLQTDAARAALLDLLARAESPAQTEKALQGLAFYTDAEALGLVERSTRSDSDQLRAAAHEALLRQALLLYERTGDGEAALGRLFVVRAWLESEYGSGHPGIPEVQLQMGSILLELGRLDEAERILSESLARHYGFLGRDDPVAVPVFIALAEVYRRKRDFGQAEKLLLEALALRPDHLETLERLASFYRDVGDEGSAQEIERRMRAIESGQAPKLFKRG